jgi:pimeloyl-ACP methyl ester carboxylesterase
MLRQLGRALLVWLCVLEALAGVRGWWGLSWLGRGRQRWLLVPLALAALRPARPWAWAASLAATAPAAMLLHGAAASLRHPALDPLLRLRPGRYPDRTITRCDIPLDGGGLPALHIVPVGGAQAAVCKLHGSGDDKTEFAWPMVDRLIARGIAVLLVDLDGHGESPRPQRYPEILRNASAAVGWLRARYRRVGLVGVSLGGCVAARAVADGLAVDALAVLEAPPRLHFTRGDMAREALALASPAVLELCREGTPAALIRAMRYAPIRAEISTWDLIAALDLPASLPRITAPLLAIYGGGDAIVKPAQAAEVRRCLPPAARFALIPRASHLTLILTPAALDLLAGWLAEQLLAGAVGRSTAVRLQA